MSLTLRVPRQLLDSRRKDLLMLLRVAAGVNAMEATARLLSVLGRDSSSATQLSRLHLFLAALGYFREIVKTIEKAGYEARLLELVEKGAEFAPVVVPVPEVRRLLSPAHPEIGGSVLLKIRDKVAFHWDPEPFTSLLDTAEIANLDLWTIDGDPPDRVFSASAHAMAQFAYGVPVSGTTVEDWANGLLDAVMLVGHAIESAFLGLIVEVDPPPRKFVVRD